MGFSNQERINLFTKALAAGVFDANSTAVWYESKFPFTFILDGDSVWTNLAGIPAAANLTTARSNATANPTIIEDLSQNADTVRLTLVAGTNDSTYAAYETYNDTSSELLKNWILPQLVPQTSGTPSIGYAIALYDGDPGSGGTLVTTTDGTTGTGVNKTVGWIFNYASGILILSDDFKDSISDPYILGFRYIGTTANDSGSGSISGSIASTQVAFGSGTNTISGENDFTYDTSNNLLEVEKVESQVVVQVNNASASRIDAGSVVYVDADGSSIPEVALADASDSAKMPSIGIVPNAINAGSNGFAVLTGRVNGLDGSAGNTVFDSTITSSDVGATVYVSPTNPGRLTVTKPTGTSELIQNVGRIIDTNGNNVKIAVSNIGRTNDVPNSFSTTGEIDAGSLTVNSAYSFPTTDGTDGQVLVTDGAGTLTFSDSSVVTSFVADETIAVGESVRAVNSSDAGLTPGRVILANASELSSGRFIGIATSAGNQGDSIRIVTNGLTAVKFSSAPGSTTNGQAVYVSSTYGIATLTAPSSSGDTIYELGTLISGNGSSTTPNVQLNFREVITLG